ncbi:MAG: TrkH family potassium uptake protein [Deltaproteobacteria bacterium]|nr:TrkH family potassium uptake protein [bacterium]MCB9479416.1 TrkH family potassium uptake protein [Deltaproteobacteria bacterium]MCB9488626.1 TrkH family potassium uptake protein [Deltaproteobacteria bacterium]
MRYRFVFSTLGALTLAIGVMLLAPLIVALIYRETAGVGIGMAMLLSVAGGFLVWRVFSAEALEINLREGMFIVSCAWVIAFTIGALPYYFTGTFAHFTDCFFESASGFTTTGASVSTDIEAMPKCILFWRAMTHWLGGMGIILLSVAILPLIGVGGMQLFRAEVPGPTADKITPRVAETARMLWLVYFGLTVIEVVLLMLGGMPLFDSICHSFATVATGGFSTKNASIGHYQSSYIHFVISLFMFLAGMNFALHYAVVTGRFRTAIRDNELRLYTIIVLAASALCSIMLIKDLNTPVFTAIRDGIFQVLSIITTTGFATADYEIWSPAAQSLILLLFFIGGCTGSTGGGPKVMRIDVLLRQAYNELFFLVHPRAVKPPKYGREVIPGKVLRSIWSFFFLYMGVFGIGMLMMGLMEVDILTASTSVASALGNIGPAFGTTGPTENYAHIPMMGKWVLIFCMLLGRLEIYTILILFAPAFWRK